jgi:hypothetical protein
MSLYWVVVGLVGWVLGLVFVFALFKLSHDQDHAARREEKQRDPFSDVHITQSGNG